MLHLKAKGLSARGYEGSDGFVVLAGSESPKEHVASLDQFVIALRKHLSDEGLLVTRVTAYAWSRTTHSVHLPPPPP